MWICETKFSCIKTELKRCIILIIMCVWNQLCREIARGDLSRCMMGCWTRRQPEMGMIQTARRHDPLRTDTGLRGATRTTAELQSTGETRSPVQIG